MRDANNAKSPQENSTVDRSTNSTNDNNQQFEAEVESAAAAAEPMGSVAAAVKGSNQLAQDAKRTGAAPGAESPAIRDEPETTAGTEAKLECEEREIEQSGREPDGRKNAA